MSHAVFDGEKLTMQLPRSIHERFVAKSGNYMRALRVRNDIPNGLRVLIARLFQEGVITNCAITQGKRVELTLSSTGSRGRLLSNEESLEWFKVAFADITGMRLAAMRSTPITADEMRRAGRSQSGGPATSVALSSTLENICNRDHLASKWAELSGGAS
jgi:hypothetical protein